MYQNHLKVASTHMPSPAAFIDIPAPAWEIAATPVAYPDAVARMEQRVADIKAGTAKELVWLLEHPPLYTAGSSAKPSDLLEENRFPVYGSGRGGQYTYHGPGQRVAYVMLDLKQRAEAQGKAPDLRAYVQQLEQWIIATLAECGIKGEVREGRIGVWVVQPDGREEKIAAIGVRVRRWVTYHGIALNVCPDLSHYAGIVPCGIRDHGVISLQALGVDVGMEEVDKVLRACFTEVFL